MNENVQYEKIGKVLVITLQAEKSLNALDSAMIEDMVDTLRAFERDPEMAAVVVTGSGKAFCTGADLKKFTEMPQEEIVKYCADYGEDLFNYLATMKKPTIAAVNGYAMGGGFELALACDFRVMSDRAFFSAPEYGFGWIPGWGGVTRLAKIVGASKAKEIMLFKRRVNAEDAVKLGIAMEAVPGEQLLDRAVELAGQLAELNPLTVAFTKAVLDDFDIPKSNSYLQGFCVSMTSKTEYARHEAAEFFRRTEEKRKQRELEKQKAAQGQQG